MRQAPNQAASSTERANTPTVSSEPANGKTPVREMAPKLGLNPTTPQKAAGRMTEPRVCVPMATGTKPVATAAAEPLEEPPGVCAGFQGLRVLPGVRKANSVVTVLPITRPPRASRRRTTQAEWLGMLLWNTREPMRVGIPRVLMMSLTPTGMP
jgi:hypothetical protein